MEYCFVPLDDLLAHFITCLQDQWQLVLDGFDIKSDEKRLLLILLQLLLVILVAIGSNVLVHHLLISAALIAVIVQAFSNAVYLLRGKLRDHAKLRKTLFALPAHLALARSNLLRSQGG